MAYEIDENYMDFLVHAVNIEEAEDENFEKMTSSSLKAVCTQCGLPTTGKKQMLLLVWRGHWSHDMENGSMWSDTERNVTIQPFAKGFFG